MFILQTGKRQTCPVALQRCSSFYLGKILHSVNLRFQGGVVVINGGHCGFLGECTHGLGMELCKTERIGYGQPLLMKQNSESSGELKSLVKELLIRIQN